MGILEPKLYIYKAPESTFAHFYFFTTNILVHLKKGFYVEKTQT